MRVKGKLFIHSSTEEAVDQTINFRDGSKLEITGELIQQATEAAMAMVNGMMREPIPVCAMGMATGIALRILEQKGLVSIPHPDADDMTEFMNGLIFAMSQNVIALVDGDAPPEGLEPEVAEFIRDVVGAQRH